MFRDRVCFVIDLPIRRALQRISTDSRPIGAIRPRITIGNHLRRPAENLRLPEGRSFGRNQGVDATPGPAGISEELLISTTAGRVRRLTALRQSGLRGGVGATGIGNDSRAHEAPLQRLELGKLRLLQRG